MAWFEFFRNSLYFELMGALSFVIGFGILQAVLLAALLIFAPRTHRIPNLFMAGLVLVISSRLLQGWLAASGQLAAATGWALPFESLAFTWGPLLYLYAHSMSRQNLNWLQLLHFLPWLAIVLLILPYYLLDAEARLVINNYLWYGRYDSAIEQQVQQVLSPFQFIWIKYRVHATAFILHFGAYCLLIIHRLNQHNHLLQSHYSSVETLNLRWLRTLTLTCLIYLVILLVLKRVPQMFFAGQGMTMELPYIALVLLIYMIVVSALYQPSILHGVIAANELEKRASTEPDDNAAMTPHTDPEVIEESCEGKKYARSSLSLADAQHYKTQLMEVTRQQQLYLNSELTLPELAAAADLTPHQVSQVLNGQLGQNFFTFINNYRIGRAKELMADPAMDHLAIVDLAFEVGFKSKSSFYDAFKRATQLTPSKYRNSLRVVS